MKALTICQPYAHLICLPDDDARAKRVENRTWSTDYRGPLLVHAGKSRKFLSGDNYGIPIESMDFGAIIGVCQLAECFRLGTGTLTIGMMIVNGVEIMPPGTSVIKAAPDHIKRRFPWIEQHEHTEGPFCFVLTRVRRFEKPIPYRGSQGFFDVPMDAVLEAVQ
jgi:hypothetical protein